MTRLDIPTTEAGRRAWVLYRLKLAGYTLGSLARELGVVRQCPEHALTGPYPRMERAIAAKIGVKPQQIWPERYTPEGKPNRPMGRPRQRKTRVRRSSERSHDDNISTRPGSDGNVQRGEAA